MRDTLAREGYRRLVVAGQAEDLDRVKPSSVMGAGGWVEWIAIGIGDADEGWISARAEEPSGRDRCAGRGWGARG